MKTIVIAFLIAFAPTAVAGTLSGRVTNGSVGIAGVDLDVFDGGNQIATTNDNTDANGFFSFAVPDGRFDVFFTPPAGSRYVELERRDVNVAGPTDIGTTVLESGFLVTGALVRQNGSPIANVPMRFVNVTTGDVFETRVHTSTADGSFSFAVPSGTWDFEIRPAKATRLVARVFEAMTLGPDRPFGSIVLESGFLLSMTVRRTNGAGVSAVDIDVHRVSPAERIFTPGDNTDASGLVQVVAPPGNLEVNVGPDPNTRLVARNLLVTLTADSTLPDVILQSGFFLSGTASGSGGAVAAADVDVFDAFNGTKIPTEQDNTDVTGFFRVVVPAGAFNVEVQPPLARRLAGARILKVDVTADVNIGLVSLASGFVVSGTVRDAVGQPVAGVDMDLFDAADSEVPTIADTTAANGTYAIVVPAGATDVMADTELESGHAAVLFSDVSVGADTVRNVVLPQASISGRLSLQEVGVFPAGFLHFSVDLRNHAGAPRSGLVRVEASARGGSVRRTLIFPTQVNLDGSSAVVSFGSFQRRVPGRIPASLMRVPVTVTLFVTDLSGQTELDRDVDQLYVY